MTASPLRNDPSLATAAAPAAFDAAAAPAPGQSALTEQPVTRAGDAAILPADAHAGLPGQARPTVTGGEFAAPAPAFSASGALTQVGGALLGILLLIVIGGWLLKTLRLTPAGRSGNRLAIRASCSVGPREKVLIMQVDDTWLVLGVTPQHITTLHSLPAPAQTEHDACGPAPEDFRQRLLRLSRQRSGNA